MLIIKIPVIIEPRGILHQIKQSINNNLSFMVPKKAYLSNNRCADDIDYDDHQSCLQKCDNKIYNIFNNDDDDDMTMKTII